jgi:hypothetical protein
MCNGFGDLFSDEKGCLNMMGVSTQFLVEAIFNLAMFTLVAPILAA